MRWRRSPFVFAATAMAPGIVGLIAAQSLAGLAAGVGLPAIYAFAAQIAPDGQESKILGRVLVGWTLSLVAGVSLSSLLADIAHWRLVFALLAGLTALCCLVVFRTATQPHARPQGPVRFPLAAFTLSGVKPLLAICFAFMTAFYGAYAFIGDHIHEALGLPIRAGGLIAISYGTGFALASLGDGLIDRIGIRRIMPWSMALIALAYAVMGTAAGSFPALIALAACWGAANHFGLNVIVGGLSALHPEKRGIVLGLNSAVTYLAAFAGAVAFGPLYESHGFQALCLLSSALAGLAAVIALIRRPNASPRDQMETS